jgi:hypothetical protein
LCLSHVLRSRWLLANAPGSPAVGKDREVVRVAWSKNKLVTGASEEGLWLEVFRS